MLPALLSNHDQGDNGGNLAIWQFCYSLIPKLGLQNKLKYPVETLPEYGNRSDYPTALDQTDTPNYWDGFENIISEHIPELSGLLPEMNSWSEDARMYGTQSGDRIEIWNNDIDCIIDIRKINYELILATLDIAKRMNCLLVIHGSGRLIEPEIKLLREEILNSNSAKFITDPEGYITGNRK